MVPLYSDRVPMYHQHLKTWEWLSDGAFGAARPDIDADIIPEAIYALLKTGKRASHVVVETTDYPTKEAALADLAQAIIAYETLHPEPPSA